MQHRQRPARPLLAVHARVMRHQPTPSEAVLWAALSGGKCGASFRRQVPVAGRFIADFLAARERVIVEVDGGCHARRATADARRDRALARLGYTTLRLDALLVLRDLPEAVRRVRAALERARHG